jgi:protein-disulfide isomerase
MTPILRALAAAALLAPLAACGARSGDAADSSATAAAPAASAADPAGAPTTPPTPDPRVTAADGARIKGDPNAKVWIVVVSDFQCPYCAQWERQTAQQVITEFVETGVARLAFVNFPLRQHPNALPAAEAAMCAGAQGKFWELHDRIFATQEEWSGLPSAEAFFEQAAGAVGVALPEYQACIRDHVMRPMIEADVERATSGGAGSTPTFFVGSQVISGAEKIDVFRTAVKDAQAAAAR